MPHLGHIVGTSDNDPARESPHTARGPVGRDVGSEFEILEIVSRSRADLCAEQATITLRADRGLDESVTLPIVPVICKKILQYVPASDELPFIADHMQTPGDFAPIVVIGL